MQAEEDLQLPPRDTSGIDKDHETEKKHLKMGKRLRRTRGNDV